LFQYKDVRRRFNEAWPSLAAQYRGKKNSETVVAEKSQVLAVRVIHNLDAAVDLAEKSEVQTLLWARRSLKFCEMQMQMSSS
jgi:hypothetical protein